MMKEFEKGATLESLSFVLTALKEYQKDLAQLKAELRRETGRGFEDRFEAFKNLSYGYVPEPVLRSVLYSLEKLEKGSHIDNVDLLYNVLSSVEGIDERYLALSRTLIDLLQQPILEADDTLDHLPRNDVEMLCGEAIKALNPALFVNTLMNEAKKHPENLDRFVKAGNHYLKNIGELFGTPIKYVENQNIYFETSDKETEIIKLAETQVLRASHLRVYIYPITYILDPHPSEDSVERIAQLLERSRGISLLIKDIYDLEQDITYNNYNPVTLILTKYKDADNPRSIVKTDILAVGKMLFDDIAVKFVDVESRYFSAASSIYADAQGALTALENELEKFANKT